jgi:hypothetical protein
LFVTGISPATIDPFKALRQRNPLIAGADRTMPETIANACHWRLLAEEILTEADDFSSPSAKETTYYVANTWDRMADDLEKRFSKPADRLLIF